MVQTSGGSTEAVPCICIYLFIFNKFLKCIPHNSRVFLDTKKFSHLEQCFKDSTEHLNSHLNNQSAIVAVPPFPSVLVTDVHATGT